MPAKSNFLKIEKEKVELLLEQAKSGNSRSFENLSIHIKDISYSYFISKFYAGKMNNKDDAEDLTSTVYISFAEQYNNIQNIEHWLRRVLFLTFVNWYKKNKKLAETELDETYHNIESDNTKSDKFDIEKIISFVNDLSQSWKIKFEDRLLPAQQTIVDTRFLWKKEDMSVYMDITNLFNENYEDIPGVPMPGRWFKVGFELNLLNAE